MHIKGEERRINYPEFDFLSSPETVWQNIVRGNIYVANSDIEYCWHYAIQATSSSRVFVSPSHPWVASSFLFPFPLGLFPVGPARVDHLTFVFLQFCYRYRLAIYSIFHSWNFLLPLQSVEDPSHFLSEANFLFWQENLLIRNRFRNFLNIKGNVIRV